ncbi:glycoside hydrolase family 28 protein [Winogradskyella sp.]|uniref:glycoside hydrolase family 28 protein n=1 Tax=Winogradskyella sp. TaxID=1883156 RepID=UPI00263431D1|nr:glycoside hydrolase family 28 protein [Winogradskyella sp.]
MKRFVIIIITSILIVGCKKNRTTINDFSIEYAKAKIDTAWNMTYPKIVKKIVPPKFKPDTIVVNDTIYFRESLHKAMTKLSETGGGVVHIPTGNYKVNGPIVFRSNINLNLAENAILEFSPHPEDYLPVVKTRWEGTFAMNYSPLIYAIDKVNLAITGKGQINGNCKPIWSEWKFKQKEDKKRIRQMGNDQIPIEERVFGEGHFLRPSGIQFINCQNILFEDFTIQETPFWTIHPVLCKNVITRYLNIKKGTHNDDGFDPENSQYVLIENCNINTYDDCISIKAGRDQDGWDYPPSENIIIRNNTFSTAVGSGFCIGSEMSGGVQNLFVHDNTLNGSKKHAFQFKSNPDRGGFIKDVFIKNFKALDTVKYGLEFTTDYKGWRGNKYYTLYSDFYFQNIDVNKATDISIKINGRNEQKIKRVYLENLSLKESSAPFIVNHTQNLILNKVSINGKQITNADVNTTLNKDKK